MPYEISIRRDGAYDVRNRPWQNPITLDEWKHVVLATEGLRFAEGNSTITNPATGEVVSVRGNTGDVEIETVDDNGAPDGWLLVFFWARSGAVRFNAAVFEMEDGELDLAVPLDLAKRLDAQLFGEQGEVYNFPIKDAPPPF